MRSSKSSSGSAKSSFEQVGETLNKLDQITKSVADSTGMTQTQVATIAFGASAQLGLNNRLAGGKLSARADKSYLSGLSAQEQKVLGSMSSEQLAEFKQFGDRVSRDESFSSLISNDSKQARDMSSRLASTTSRSERAEASLAERTAFAERVSNAYERGETISIDIAQDPHNLAMFTRYAEQYGSDSAAAHTLMEAELARQSLRPNRHFSDGTALPTSFPDLDSQHAQERRDARLTTDINAHRQNNEQQVLRVPKGQPVKRQPAVPTATREEVQTQGARIQSQADASRSEFDTKSELIRAEDGTLSSTRSLLKQSSKQVAKDAGASVDNVKDAVKDLLKK